jgi:primosomal protein N' (replication factor Y) (superfamily II helicase)
MAAHLAQVVPFSMGKALTYRVEGPFAESVAPGSLVKIPLGRTVADGIVTSSEGTQPPFGRAYKLKSLYEVLYPTPILTPDLLSLAQWMASYYGAPLGSVFEMMIPSVIRDEQKTKVEKLFERLPAPATLPRLGPQQAALWEKFQSIPVGATIGFSELKTWNFSPSIAAALVAKGLLRARLQDHYRAGYDDNHSDAELVQTLPPALMDEQAAAVERFSKLLAEGGFHAQLLHGVTGSGKTEVYLRLIQHVLDSGGTALLMVPEVALTPQTIGRIRGRFGNDPERCVVWHSHLSPGERADAYRAVVSGKCRMAVGARSALFLPLKDLKLIIVDEEHEGAYKQEESPRYHARDGALKRAEICGALCLLGSATPSMEAIAAVRNDKMGLELMLKRVDDRPMPVVHVVDLRKSLGKTPWLSPLLKDKIADRLDKKEQILLFLNRRGHSTSFLCQKCGYIAMCDRCSLPMTYHAVEGELRCHLCGAFKKAPTRCPECGSDQVKWRGVGTQKIETLLHTIFPHARVARVDADAMAQKNTLRATLAEFRRGNLDMLIGTQMIAKGLDFPNVTLVGMIDADLSLHQPDFRAAERTFQLLVQVAGRSGRGDRTGEVVVQTFLPQSSTLQYARHCDYDGFVEEELGHREQFGYPPFRHLIRHLFRSPNPEKLAFYCEAWAKEVARILPSLEVRGPSPAPIERIEGLYRYQIWYLCDDVEPTVAALTAARAKFPFDGGITDTMDVDAAYLG